MTLQKNTVVDGRHLPAYSPTTLTLLFVYAFTDEHPWRAWVLGAVGMLVVIRWLMWLSSLAENTAEPEWKREGGR